MSPAVQDLPSETPTDRSALRAALREGLEEAAAGSGIALVGLPAPVVPSEKLLMGTEDDALAWAVPGRFELAALGETAALTAEGPERFQQVAGAAAELFAHLHSVGVAGAAPPPLRLFGGFSFTGEPPRSGLWGPLGAARFVLPALGYLRDLREGGRATLFVSARADELRRPSMLENVLERALAALAALAVEDTGIPPAWSDAAGAAGGSITERPADEWHRLVEAIGREIARGELEKVVLARRVVVDLQREPDPALVLARLRDEAPECTRFLLRREGTSFLGATPEWLARKHGAMLETEAVAGSMSASDRQGARRLLESAKDSAEHAFVVREIVRALEPLASRLDHPAEPALHELRHVLHLRTKIVATLKDSTHLLDIVERLHPTPAVGGVPTDRALEWIRTHEPDERGWYAGPFGWFDAQGDGEMAVALRSGVVRGREAHLFVGSGIVERSAPAAEFAETRWKLAGLLAALGVSP
ncbi:MAG TPA: isochorismate synthase [Thermoanaerobaculia bacterium]|nr:isochorismate synthase [Thermoanaerobaculia bacterium]